MSTSTTESAELLQARCDIADLQTRVTYLETTLKRVLEQHERLLQLIPQTLQRALPSQDQQVLQHLPQTLQVNVSPQLPHTPRHSSQPHYLEMPPQQQTQNNQSTSIQDQQTAVTPIPLRASKVLENTLPSSEIRKDKLSLPSAVLTKYNKLKCRAPTLAMHLAREAFFGEDVMERCTPNGNRDLPGLPRDELYQLKIEMFRLFPKYWAAPQGFEALWATCMTSIEQCCKRIRLARQKSKTIILS